MKQHGSRWAGSNLRYVYPMVAVFILMSDLGFSFSNNFDYQPSLPLLGLMCVVLASGALWSPQSELAYCALFITSEFLPEMFSLGYAIFGLFAICIVWLIRHWTWQSIAVLALCEGVLLLTTDEFTSQLVSVFTGGGTVLALGFLFRLLRDNLQSTQSQLHETQEVAQKAEQQIRAGLATQLHDTVAKDLARVAIMAENIAVQNPELSEQLKPLTEMAHQASKRIRPVILNLDTVGSSPSLEDAISTSGIMLKTRDLTLVVESEPGLDQKLDRQTIQTASLFVRETATNALKYSEPGTDVELMVALEDDTLTMTMRNVITSHDIPTEITGGYGLTNLKHRIREEGGSMTFSNRNGNWLVAATLPNRKGEHDE